MRMNSSSSAQQWHTKTENFGVWWFSLRNSPCLLVLLIHPRRNNDCIVFSPQLMVLQYMCHSWHIHLPSSVAAPVVLQGSQLDTNSWTLSFCTHKQIFCCWAICYFNSNRKKAVIQKLLAGNGKVKDEVSFKIQILLFAMMTFLISESLFWFICVSAV